MTLTQWKWLRISSGIGIGALIVMALSTKLGQAATTGSAMKEVIATGQRSGGGTPAARTPTAPKVAEIRKTKDYVKDGLFNGGDRAIQDVLVRDIRHSINPDYERIVLDVEGTLNGEASAIARPPYFQVDVAADKSRMEISVWGKPKLQFSAKAVNQSFAKSKILGKLELLPRLEADHWTFTVGLKPKSTVEVFELSNPVRIIIDVRGDPAQSRASL